MGIDARLTLFLSIAISCALFAGCGGESTGRTPAAPFAPRALLSSVPVYSLAGDSVGEAEYSYAADSDSSKIRFTAGGDDSEITMPGVGILWIGFVEVDDTEYLLVSTVDSNDASTLHRLHDSGTDGVPDLSTRVEVVDSGTSEQYWTDVEYDDTEDVFVVLDIRCADIWIATDTDSDEWPDTMNTAPFASSQSHASLEDVNRILLLNLADEYLVLAGTPRLGGSLLEHADFELRDTDTDWEVDSVTATAFPATVPTVVGTSYDGQSSVTVAGDPALAGKTVEIWNIDDPETLLGSATIDSNGGAVVSVFPALSEDDHIAIRLSTGTYTERVFTVIDTRPQVLSIDPRVLDPNVATSVTVTGINLATDTKLRVFGPLDLTPQHDLETTFVSGTEVTVLIPALGNDSPLRLNVDVYDPDSPNDPSVPVDLDVDNLDCYALDSFTPANGPTGTTVTVTGRGFELGPVLGVTVGDVAVAEADIVVQSDTELIIKIPSGAVTGTIEIDHGAWDTESATNFVVTP